MNTLKEKSYQTLELQQVLELLAAQTQTARGREAALALRPADNLYESQRRQQETADAVFLMGLYGSPGFGGLRDVTDSVTRADMGGSLNPSELLQIAALLRSARNVKAYVEKPDQNRTSLDVFFQRLSGNKYLEEKIYNAFLSEEELADNASPALNDIRRNKRAAASRVRDVLNRIVSSNSKMLQDSIVTQRDGRYVVPVKAEYKNAFGGLVHDVSSSGATFFIEPQSVVELNNTLRELEAKEKQEIARILAELSAEVASFAGPILGDYDTLCILDLIFAKGKLSYKMKASRPTLVEQGRTELNRARHPLLDPDKAVPITFAIGGKTDTVIITGPNTGGKTVSIKTLGLLTLMAQCGLQLPVGGDSTVRICPNVLSDIGDEQSIQQSLSTFSAHMTNIVRILEKAGPGDLVLLDELGAGTDPIEGAALAVSIIEELRSRGVWVAATTHYAEMKLYALETPGVENASCEFDVQTLMPTYKLVFGIPGKSNAFAISRRLGLEEGILRRAEQSIGVKDKAFEDVISQLDERRQELERELATAKRQAREAEELNRRATERMSNLERDRDKLIFDARLQAQGLIEEARRSAEQVLEEAKRLKQEAADGKDANLAAARAAFRGELNEAQKKVQTQKVTKQAMPLPRSLRAGDVVEIVSTGTRGTVLTTPAGKEPVLVQAGILKITVKQSDLQLLDQSDKPKEQPRKRGPVLQAPTSGGMEVDLRGQSADEAIMELERFIDTAIRRRLETVRIIHGKGTGVLRKAVQQRLKAMPQVKSFRLGLYGEGEDGVTIATLK